MAAEKSLRVTAKDKAVVKNDQIDHNNEEETQPESVEVVGNGDKKIRIISKTFLPPERWKFKVFKDTATHVDIWANPEGLGFDRLKDTDAEVKIRGVFPAPKNAGNFPLRGEGNLQSPAGPGGAPTEWHWAAKVLDVKVDLDIHNGQGGDEVPEEKEETVGAFTVANLNDTDGDGTVDNADNNVKATAAGRDEVDLMKLILRKPEPDVGGKVTLKVVSGKVKFWRKSTKQAEVKNLEFATATLPLTLWVEATDVSGAVRDIVIEMDYKGVKDTIKATGVWADFLSFRNRRGDGLSRDADGAEINRQFASNGGALGMQMVEKMVPGKGRVLFFHNNVEIGFTVRPAGVGGEPGVAFDISRQGVMQGVNFINQRRTVLPAEPYPVRDELPNDDDGGGDEDVVPQNDHFLDRWSRAGGQVSRVLADTSAGFPRTTLQGICASAF